ncbi:MAG: hypothetical protein DHS20C16_19240 [Phycisphaerae bacterium]|nr:MAG: hypothetical protein DHS20C16_19240 [Phycisphaerae bacterium]
MGSRCSLTSAPIQTRAFSTLIVALFLGIGLGCQPPVSIPGDDGSNNDGSGNDGSSNGDSNNGDGNNGGGNNGGTVVAVDNWAAIILDDDGSLIGADSVDDRIVRINRATGAATLISGAGAGSGPELDRPLRLFLDADGSLLVTTQLRLVFRIDPTTGNRTLLLDDSDPNDFFPDSFSGIATTADGTIYVTGGGDGPLIARVDLQAAALVDVDFENITFSVPDIVPSGGNTALVIDAGRRAIVEVNLTSGDETIISNVDTQFGPADTEVGTGPDFGQPPRAIAVAEDGTIYEADEANSSFGLGVSVIFAIDPATGNRTVVSGPDNGDGPEIGRPVDLVVDADGHLVMIDANYEGLLVIDPETGDRSQLSTN